MTEEQFNRPIIAIVNHLPKWCPARSPIRSRANAQETIEARGCFAAEFNTIAIDDELPWGTTACYIHSPRATLSPIVLNICAMRTQLML
jgi:dihydroxyacid dehydratase/phosphogluconate dehydratase